MTKRLAVSVEGVVQGVGFRPFVYQLAQRLGLSGFVRNGRCGVQIEVEGAGPLVKQFLTELATHLPPRARVSRIYPESRPVLGETEFRIEASEADALPTTAIAPDAATCADCLNELFDPNDRRFRYPFINCTQCGPRLTIVTGVPYDRPRTTMARFDLCDACRKEYEDPAKRRFHAQAIACPQCGPRLELLDSDGTPIEDADPLQSFADTILAGRIGALKGLGGYHLVCAAESASAVILLRQRKQRDQKPFAIMAIPEVVTIICHLNEAERATLQAPEAPIVLLRKRMPCRVAQEVAPGQTTLGVLLPYTPLHHLLLQAVGGRPLVMTSGNRTDEPIVYNDQDAVRQLAGIADCFLIHDRPIQVRCEDSVLKMAHGEQLLVRRSRGYAPRPISLPFTCPVPIVALGGQLKSTFTIGLGDQAIVSHHLGDLDHLEAYQAFVRDLELYQELYHVRPRCLVHDQHPDYLTTRYAREQVGMKLIAVQHHHAHMASCMVEHGLTEPVIAATWDGSGYGPDGSVWGGEILVGDLRQYQRVAHLREIGLPGGEQAVREPWRMAAAHLADAELHFPQWVNRHESTNLAKLRRMLDRRVQSPMTSSVGRLFDAVASLLGVRDRCSYEGQAALELEALASTVGHVPGYPCNITSIEIDTRPLIRAVVLDMQDLREPAWIARRFHQTLADILLICCQRVRSEIGLNAVVLSGGVFLNSLLICDVESLLRTAGFRVYRHHLVPPGDGGLSLGQLAVASANYSASG